MQEHLKRFLRHNEIYHDTNIAVDYHKDGTVLENLLEETIKETVLAIYDIIDNTEMTMLEAKVRSRLVRNISEKFEVKYPYE